MVTSPGFHPAGQTSSGFSCTYCTACRVRTVSSTLRPKDRLLIVECWMIPCTAEKKSACCEYAHTWSPYQLRSGIGSSTWWNPLHGASNDVRHVAELCRMFAYQISTSIKKLARRVQRIFKGNTESRKASNTLHKHLRQQRIRQRLQAAVHT